MLQQIPAVLAIVFYGISTVYFCMKFFLKKEKTLVLAFLFLVLGLLTHGFDLVLYSLEHHMLPATNLAEAFSFLGFLIMLLFVLIGRRNKMDAMGVILVPLAILAIAIDVLYRGGARGEQPMLQGGWIYVHVPLMILSVATLSFTFLIAIMYLLQEKQLKSKHPAFLYYRLPSLQSCEELTAKSLWLGFFLLTLGILAGMAWSKYLRGTYWSWDYKEIWSFITWTLYAVLIHGRLLASWRGRKAAYMTIIGFVVLLFTFIGVSLVLPSYHAF